MLAVRLVLAVQDEQYIEPFLHYVRCSEFERRFIVAAFSRREAFVKYMEQSHDSVDVVLGEAIFLEAMDRRLSRVVCILLSNDVNKAGYEHVLPQYQPLQQLLTSLAHIVRGNIGDRAANQGATLVIAVYSTVGGCGKTVVAMNLAKQLMAEGRTVFYLSLETITSLLSDTENGRQDRKGLAELLYDLKAAKDRNESLQLPVSCYAYRDLIMQGDTFGAPDNLKELLEMEGEDTRELIDYIVNNGSYDVLIIDLDSYPSARTETVLERADRVIWLVTGNRNSMEKTESWLRYLERIFSAEFNTFFMKIKFVVNRYSGEMPASSLRQGVRFELTLPYIPAWSQGAGKEALLNSAVYQRDVMKLCRELYGDANG